MNPADAEEYTQALGQVVAGGWRQVALGKRLGVPQALGISVEEWVDGRLGGYVRLSIPERREAVAELAEEGMSNVEIGDVLGVDEGTVRNDKKAASEDSEPEPVERRSGVEKDQSTSESSEVAPEPSPESAEVDLDPPAADLPAPEDLIDHNASLRRSNARRMLAKAAAATSEISSSVDQIAEAVVAQHVDKLGAERRRIERNRAVWDRLLKSIDERAAPQLRRVK